MPPRTRKPQGAVKADDAALAEARGSILKLRIGKRTYDVISDRNCPVCTHPGRLKIEERLLFNDSYRAIVDMVSDVKHETIAGTQIDWPVLTPQQIDSHFKRKHVPANAALIHQLTLERNSAMERGYEEMTGRIVDEVVFAQMVLARGQERLVLGEIEPTVKETLAAGNLIAQVHAAARDTQNQDRTAFYEQATQIFFESAREIMSEKQWEEFSHALNTNPILRQITQRAQNPGIVEGQVVEEHAAS